MTPKDRELLRGFLSVAIQQAGEANGFFPDEFDARTLDKLQGFFVDTLRQFIAAAPSAEARQGGNGDGI